MVDIFDEVSEDLRADRAQALLKRYGVLLVLAAILVVAGVAGWQAWRWQNQQSSNTVAAGFMEAMRKAAPTAAGQTAPAATTAAAAEFAAVAATAPEGYRTLARLREAAIRAEAGELPAALALWDRISADTQADPLLRGLADLLWVQHQVDAGDPAAVEGRLAALVAPDNPWRYLGLESQALLALRGNQPDRARTILKSIQADNAAPDALRGRANALLARLGEPPAAGVGG